MNKDIILTSIKPYLNSKKELTYDDFYQIFSYLENKEQYEVCNFLTSINIELVDEKSIEDAFDGKLSSGEKKVVIVKKNDEIISDKEKGNKIPLKKKREIESYCRDSNENLVLLYQRTNDERYLKALILKNKNYIYKNVYKYSYRFNHNLEIEELFQTGCIGFIKACKKFNVNKGYALLTYATFWIREVIVRTIMDTGFIIRIPVHLWEEIIKIKTKVSKYESIEDALKYENIPIEKYNKINTIRMNYLNPAYLDEQINNTDNVNFIDSISDSSCCLISSVERPEEMVEQKDFELMVENLINCCSDKEKSVIKYRYGFISEKEKCTLEEIGKIYGVSRERIRQIEQRALNKLLKKCNINKDYVILKELIKTPKNDYKFNKLYDFKQNGISYIPELSEIIERVLSLNPDNKDINDIMKKVVDCAIQNSYPKRSLKPDIIFEKIKKIQKRGLKNAKNTK